MRAKTLSIYYSFSSFLAFICVTLAISVDQWTTIDSVDRGLWRNTTIGSSPEFEGLEIARGSSVLTVVLAFVTLLFAVFNSMSWIWPKTFSSHLDTQMAYSSGITTFYALIAAGSFTSFLPPHDGDAYYHSMYPLGSSLLLYWFACALYLCKTVVAIYYLYTVSKNSAQVENKLSKNNSLRSSQKSRLSVRRMSMKPEDDGDHIGENDENQERGNWDSKTEYMLSLIGFAVGLGNIWRFPYLAYENGGGAFIIPYVIMLIIAGFPLFFMEVSIAQFASYGPIQLWNLSPALRGVGMMMVLYSSFVGVYYNMIIGYAVYYFFAIFEKEVPWADCEGYWNKLEGAGKCSTNFTADGGGLAGFESPAESYYNFHVLKLLPMEADGSMDIVWQCVIVLIISWTIVFFALIRGIKSSGKVVWFSALFPYAVLIILFVRGITLPGAYDGISYYIGSASDFSKLSDPNVWRKAATQIFFSLSVGWGGLHALSSYNNFNNNCAQDAVVVCMINCVTSIFAGFSVFSILGNMAYEYGVSVDQVVKDGRGLAFIAYPDALTKLPVSPVWCALFFVMLVTLGLDSEFTILETIATGLSDLYPEFFRKRRTSLMAGICFMLFLVGLLTCTRSGIYWIDIIDEFTGGWGLLLSTLIEITAVGTLYGGGAYAWFTGKPERLVEDIEIMIGKRSNLWWFPWKLLWYIVTPVLLIVLLVWGLVVYETNPVYSTAGNVVGWVILVGGLSFVPIVCLYELGKVACGDTDKSIFSVFLPNEQWGPYLAKHRVGTRYEKEGDLEESGGKKIEEFVNEGFEVIEE